MSGVWERLGWGGERAFAHLSLRKKDLSITSVSTKSVVHVPSCTCKGKGLLLHLYVRWGPLIRGLLICAFECTMRYGIMLLAEQSFVLLYCISGLHDAFCDKPGSGFLGCASQKWLADTQKALQCKGRGGYYFLNDFNFFLKMPLKGTPPPVDISIHWVVMELTLH